MAAWRASSYVSSRVACACPAAHAASRPIHSQPLAADLLSPPKAIGSKGRAKGRVGMARSTPRSWPAIIFFADAKELPDLPSPKAPTRSLPPVARHVPDGTRYPAHIPRLSERQEPRTRRNLYGQRRSVSQSLCEHHQPCRQQPPTALLAAPLTH